MQHLDEGMLQAWLDRPRSGLDPEEVLLIERHLQECGQCAAALEQLTGLDTRVGEIFTHAEPAEIEAPDFASVLERTTGPVATNGPTAARRREGRLRTLAWAASVVLALGVGWVMNDAYRGVSEVGGSSSDVAFVGPEEPEPEPQPAAAEATRTAATPETAAQASDVQASEERASPAESVEALAPPAQVAASDERARQQLEEEAAAVAARGDADGDAFSDPVAASAAAPPAQALDVAVGAAEPDLMALTVPGFPVLSIEEAADGTVRVTQALGPNAELLLVERPVGLADDVTDSVGAQSVLTRVIGDVEVTGSAPISADSLRVLLELLQE